MATDWIDVEVFAAALATPEVPAADCAAALRRYFGEDEGGASGRGVPRAPAALKARPALHAARLPALIEQVSFVHGGAWCTEKGQRTLGALGFALWNHREATHLLQSGRFAVCDLVDAMRPHAPPSDAWVQDLLRWLELGDRAALERLAPAAAGAAAGSRSRSRSRSRVFEYGQTPAATHRMLELQSMHLGGPEARLASCLEATVALIVQHRAVQGLAAWLRSLDGPADPPPWPRPGWENASDRAFRLTRLELLYRLRRDHRPLFDRFGPALLRDASYDAEEILALLGAVEARREIHRGGRFWRILRFGPCLCTTWGKAGSGGTTRLKACAGEAAARRAMDAAARRQLRRPGAVEVTNSRTG